MNAKKIFGYGLEVLGSPSTLLQSAAALCLPDSLYNKVKHPIYWLTLPCEVIGTAGYNLRAEAEQEEFDIETQELETVILPNHYCWICENDDRSYIFSTAAPTDNDIRFYDDKKEQEIFITLTEARLFLQNLGYREVKSVDSQRCQTYWIK